MTRRTGSPALAKHNLSYTAYDSLLDSQNGVCALCFKDAKLVIDHDHDCCRPTSQWSKTCGRCIRGLLCYRCNNLLGYLEGTPLDVLVRAIRYLDGHNPRAVDRGIRDELVPELTALLRYAEAAA